MRPLIALALLAGTAHAEIAPVSEAPKPMPAHRQMPRKHPPRVQPVSAEIAKLGKAIAGSYDCSGTEDHLVVSLGLDDAWIEYRFDHAVEYRTYDPVAKEWTRVRIDATGSHVDTSLGEVDGKWAWSAGDTETISLGTIKRPGQLCIAR